MVFKKVGILCLILAMITLFATGCGGTVQAPQQPPSQEQNDVSDLPPDANTPEEELVYADGVYEGVGQGYNGDIILELTITGGTIINIEIVDSSETESIGGAAYSELIVRALEAQDFNLDTVSGATKTTQGFSEALDNALSKASR